MTLYKNPNVNLRLPPRARRALRRMVRDSDRYANPQPRLSAGAAIAAELRAAFAPIRQKLRFMFA